MVFNQFPSADSKWITNTFQSDSYATSSENRIKPVVETNKRTMIHRVKKVVKSRNIFARIVMNGPNYGVNLRFKMTLSQFMAATAAIMNSRRNFTPSFSFTLLESFTLNINLL
jgi:hypothetical protein